MTRATLLKERYLIRVAIFRGYVHYHGAHGGVQVDVVLGKQLSVLHFASSKKWSEAQGGT